VGLSPQVLTLRRLSRGPRARELNRYRFDVDAADGAHDWKPALATLKSKVETLAWRKSDLHVVLSGHLTRFVVMPWTENITEQDAGAYARHQFHAIYGSSADAWAVCLGRAFPRMPRVAAATERALVDDLSAQAAALDLRLRSLRPYLSAVVDALPAQDQALSGWIALIEPLCMHVACLDAGHCIDIRSVRSEGDPVPLLLSLLQQSALATDRDTDSAHLTLYSADAPDCALLHAHGWRVVTAATQLS
jgi:hypothetical protein